MAVAEQLLLHGADVELPDNYGQSPLFMACWKGLTIITIDIVRVNVCEGDKIRNLQILANGNDCCI